MNADNLPREVRDRGGSIWVEDGQVEMEVPESFPNALIDTLKEHKPELMMLFTWPPTDAADLVAQWEDVGCPPIPLSPGLSISDLERWISPVHQLPTRNPEHIIQIRHFLLEHLPAAEVPGTNPALEGWCRTSIPFWVNELRDAEAEGDTASTDYARHML